MKYILFNAGRATREAFEAGIDGAPLQRYKTRKLALHIAKDGSVAFLHRGRPVNFSDSYIFTRLRATDQHFCGMLYEYFKHHNIPANDPIHLQYPNSKEKTTQMLLLALEGIKIPETIICREESFEANQEYIESHATFPAIFKTDGSQGRNVHLVEDRESLRECIDKKEPEVLCIIQPFIQNDFDTRTLVAYGEVLGSIKRTRKNGHLNNVAQGATVEQYELSPEEKELALKVTNICRLDFSGVDMIHTDDGPIVLEVNKSPQIHGFESVHDFKVFTRIAELIRQKFA